MNTVNIAFVGCGGIAGAHFRGFSQLHAQGFRDFRIQACCDLIPEKAQTMADRFAEAVGDRPAVFTDYHEMLRNEPGIDAIGIFTPHHNHHSIAITCMNAGKHVMTEKPLGFTLRAGQKMIQTAQDNNVLLHVAENYRLAPGERAVTWAVQSGQIGTPRLLNWMDVGERKWHWQWRDHKEIAAGGWTLDGGVHFSDLWQLHIGPIHRVTAAAKAFDTTRYIEYKSMEEYQQSLKQETPDYRKTRSLKRIDPNTLKEPVESDLEDTTSAILEFENGVIGTWLVSRSAPGKVDRHSILYGSTGALSWREGIFSNGELVTSWDDLIEQYMKSLAPEEKEKLFPFGLTDTFSIQDKQFVDAIQGGDPVEVDAWTGYRAMAIPMAVYESAALHAPVLVQDVLDLAVEEYQGQLNQLIGL